MMGMRWPLATTDGELVRRARRGDPDAYGMLVTRHQGPLYRHARGMGLDHDTSLDLVQDAFIRGYARLDECRDAEHVRAWLFRITRNLCLDHLKNVRRRTLSLADISNEELAASTRSHTELAVSIADALDRLPVSMREAFLLKHDAGYSYEEIADLTQTSVSAAKMRVHRAREALSEMLSDRAVA
jgi:RNA polymerase sigma-70 factor, ECF subfamily